MPSFAPEACHEPLFETAAKSLAFNPENDYQQWRKQVDVKLRELIGAQPEKVPLNLRIQDEKENGLFSEKRFVFTSEAHADVPGHLVIPKNGESPFPVVICLQGHTSGMHISLGRAKYEGDEESICGDRDFAIQAVREGYAALVIEQRCFGERKDSRPERVQHLKNSCHHASMSALLLGRTMIGERVGDVSRAIDVLTEFPEIDPSRIGCMGNSGGGTITYYAACLEPRIGIAMPSGYVCSYLWSLRMIDHCACNYIPGFMQYFDLADLAGLIAPRPFVIVAGRHDDIFPLDGVKAAFGTIQQIYQAAGATDKCRLIIGEEGHRFYAKLAWPVFRELSGW